MGLFKRQVILSACLLGTAPVANALQWRCNWGEEQDVSSAAICGTANASLDAALISRGDIKFLRTAVIESYVGMHLSPLVSFHAAGSVLQKTGARSTQERSAVTERHSDLQTAVVQLGNPVVHPLRATYGHLAIPFGLYAQDMPAIFRLFENKRLWGSYEKGGVLIIDDLRNRMLEISAGMIEDSKLSNLNPFSSIPSVKDQAVAARLSYDVSSLEGSRIIASGLALRLGERRFGFALLNAKSNGEATSFEFVRRLATPDGKGLPFEQALRFTHVTGWKSGRRVMLGVDDERQRFRSGSLFGERKIPIISESTVWRLGLVYHKAESQLTKRAWWSVVGVSAGF